MNKTKINKYAAKLLFQFRVVVDGESNKRRTCEERIILLDAASGKDALRMAKLAGKNEEHSYKNDEGNPVYFEFVGVKDLLDLGPECRENEVWYEIKSYLNPMERKSKLLIPEKELSAIKNETRN